MIPRETLDLSDVRVRAFPQLSGVLLGCAGESSGLNGLGALVRAGRERLKSVVSTCRRTSETPPPRACGSGGGRSN